MASQISPCALAGRRGFAKDRNVKNTSEDIGSPEQLIWALVSVLVSFDCQLDPTWNVLVKISMAVIKYHDQKPLRGKCLFRVIQFHIIVHHHRKLG